jgi:hypothetical protein
LREVIRKVLQEVSTSGLPGEHHFFITFRTDHPGVRLSTRMRERYPEEMTIVIQHSFWDLKIRDTYFEIDLSLNDIQVVIETEIFEDTENLPTLAQSREVSKASESKDTPSKDDEGESAEIVSLDQFRKKQ